jgi:hypothetical protein
MDLARTGREGGPEWSPIVEPKPQRNTKSTRRVPQ